MDKTISILKDNYNILITLLALILLIWGIYNKIRYLCLEKASIMVAEAENKEELSGKEKFALCVLWINQELPKVFKNALIQSIVEKAIDFAYTTSSDYLKNYIKRKTGYDISTLLEQFKIEEEKRLMLEDKQEEIDNKYKEDPQG